MLSCILFLFLLILPADPVQKLKDKSRANLARMNNVIAQQELRLWGDGKPHRLTYQVAVYNSKQTFRIDNQIVTDLPMPRAGVRPGAEWYEFMRKLPFFSLQAESYGVFSYHGNCSWREPRFDGLVPCKGRIETDEEFNVLRMNQILHPPGIVEVVQISVTYAWIDLLGKRLLPQSLEMSAVYRNGRKYFASATWRKYQVFYTGEPIARDVEEVDNESQQIAEDTRRTVPAEVPEVYKTPEPANLFLFDKKLEKTEVKVDSRAKRLLQRFRFW